MITRAQAKEIANAIQISKTAATDEQALSIKALYPTWETLAAAGTTAESAGYRFTYAGDLYKTRQPNHTFAPQWVPGQGTESLYTRIDETHAGTLEDPIPYGGNMELYSGKYYIQDGVIYRCTRDSGQPLYHALSDLVGIYVERVE